MFASVRQTPRESSNHAEQQQMPRRYSTILQFTQGSVISLSDALKIFQLNNGSFHNIKRTPSIIFLFQQLISLRVKWAKRDSSAMNHRLWLIQTFRQLIGFKWGERMPNLSSACVEIKRQKPAFHWFYLRWLFASPFVDQIVRCIIKKCNYGKIDFYANHLSVGGDEAKLQAH